MPRWEYEDVEQPDQDTSEPPPDSEPPPNPEPKPEPKPEPRPAPSYTADQAREDLRRRGVSEHVSGEEAAGIARYGSIEAAERANPGTMARYLQRSRSGGGPITPPTTSRRNPDPRFVDVQFNDPYTQQYEGILQAQLELLRMQQDEMRRRAAEEERLRVAMQEETRRKAEEAARRRAGAEEAWGRFSGYANERVAKLQGPAYTGTEQEVLRTQLLDPIERDRAAAHRRALERVSERGFRPESGLAEELRRLVDQEYNQYRAGAQGTVAQRQIDEQRSREQEAQQLLMLLAQIPDALARGDLDFINQVQATIANADTVPRRNLDFTNYAQGLVSAPGTQQIAIGDILSELPSRRLRDALAVLGAAPQGLSPVSNTSPQVMQLLQLLQNQRFGQNNQWANAFGGLGLAFQP